RLEHLLAHIGRSNCRLLDMYRVQHPVACRIERTQESRDEEHRLTQLAIIGLGSRVLKVAAGFRIKEDSAHDLLQLRWGIALGREHASNALDIAGTRVTGDQMLDKLFAD